MKIIRMAVLLTVFAGLLSSPALYADSTCDKCAKDGKMAAGKTEGGKGQFYKDLNLSDAQKKQLDENKAKIKDGMKTLFSAMKDNRAAMRQELESEKLDMSKINMLNGELKKLEAQMLDYRLQGILQVRQILTPEQFKKFMAKTEDRMSHFRERKEHKG